MKAYPLRVFVHRVLLIRLGCAAAMIAVLVGLAAYFVQRSRFTDEVLDLGARGIQSLLDEVEDTMRREGRDPLSALRDVAGRGEPTAIYRTGRFVNYQIYNRASKVLAEWSMAKDPSQSEVRARIDSWSFSFPEAGREDVRWTRINGNLFILIAVPVSEPGGRLIAYARGVFAVSPEVSARMRRAVVRSTILAVAIVLVVAALLYPVILRFMRQLSDYSTHLLDANLETLAVLGDAIAKRDSGTDAHDYRVSLYSARIGETMGLPTDAMRILIKGSFLHDIGKIGIPDRILLKPGALDEKESAVMRAHVEVGVDIIRRSSWLRESEAVVGYHHEKYGGNGYPHNLSGESIPLTARIFAVSDVFDALTSDRPYKQAFPFEKAMGILELGRGRDFDPEVLDAFGPIARGLYLRYAGREGRDLRQELVALVEKYFSAGLETLRYGDET